MTEITTPLSPAPAGPPRRRSLIIALVAGTGIAVILGWGLASRGAAEAALKRQAAQAGITTVVAAHPTPEMTPDEVVLPGQVKGEFETTLYARTNGYLRSWTADIGTHVKAGQLLAVIDSPEVDQQLLQAEADLKTAQANAADARTTADRVAGLVDTHSVSRQEGDDRAAAASATAAQVAAQQANVGRLRQLKGFERVVAPFDGVITSRTTDVGALIHAGGAQGAELFRIAAMNKLRTYVEVPQSYAAQIHVGTTGELQFPDRPGKLYPATVTRTASAIDPQARTLQVELDIDNSSGELLPGSFTEVHFKLPPSGVGLRLPGSALLFRADGVQVAKVGPNGRVVLTPITLGRDFGDTIEVLTGVTPADQVILNPPAAVANGDPVRVAAAKPQKTG
ncbi:MAG TPA: efflux RND transporter periplasmic adaptor subunit [Caulobacteraceae bacterium]|jgi:RND family efflux transporter MFP subunit|nr:efflux RND transporter periplasmic adaptor subunit [Caulobacteraceae bacterium]